MREVKELPVHPSQSTAGKLLARSSRGITTHVRLEQQAGQEFPNFS